MKGGLYQGTIMLRIRAERLKRGWSQIVLAYHSGVANSDISAIECGHLRPYPSQLARLASALEIKDPDLLLQEVREGAA